MDIQSWEIAQPPGDLVTSGSAAAKIRRSTVIPDKGIVRNFFRSRNIITNNWDQASITFLRVIVTTNKLIQDKFVNAVLIVQYFFN